MLSTLLGNILLSSQNSTKDKTMFGLGTSELLIIAGIVILLFGGKRLPELGKSMGNAITNFKKGLNEGDKKDNQTKDETKNS